MCELEVDLLARVLTFMQRRSEVNSGDDDGARAASAGAEERAVSRVESDLFLAPCSVVYSTVSF